MPYEIVNGNQVRIGLTEAQSDGFLLCEYDCSIKFADTIKGMSYDAVISWQTAMLTQEEHTDLLDALFAAGALTQGEQEEIVAATSHCEFKAAAAQEDLQDGFSSDDGLPKDNEAGGRGRPSAASGRRTGSSVDTHPKGLC